MTISKRSFAAKVNNIEPLLTKIGSLVFVLDQKYFIDKISPCVYFKNSKSTFVLPKAHDHYTTSTSTRHDQEPDVTDWMGGKFILQLNFRYPPI